MSDYHQLHLFSKGSVGYSGRGVRLLEITYDMIEEAKINAAREAKDDRAMGVRILERELMYRAISHVTEPGITPEKLPEAKWLAVTALELQTPGKMSLSSLFKPKDIQLINTFIERNYFASTVEAEMILGGVLAVSGG